MSYPTPVHQTRSGKYVAFDVTDPAFFPGKQVPTEYTTEARVGTWFFWPLDWLGKSFGGIFTAWRVGYPALYSPGFPSGEEAIKAAEGWEADEAVRKEYEAVVLNLFHGQEAPCLVRGARAEQETSWRQGDDGS